LPNAGRDRDDSLSVARRWRLNDEGKAQDKACRLAGACVKGAGNDDERTRILA
jgi:hypothetical protein